MTARLRVRQTAAVLIAASPAIIVPLALDRFVFGKLVFIAAGIALAWMSPAAGRLPRRLVWALGVALVILAIAGLASGHPLISLLGREPRFEGVLVLFVYVAALATGARLIGPARDSRVTRPLLGALAVAIGLICFIAILEAFGLRPLTSNVSRPGSLLGNASDEGAVAVLAFGPLAANAVRDRSRWLGLGAIAALSTVVLSASRGALAGLILELVLWAAIASGRRVRLATLAVVVIAVAAAFALPSSRDRIVESTPLARHTVVGRELLWRETVALDAHHLLLGVGPSNYKTAITSENDREWQERIGPTNPPDSPHDLPLQVLSDAGIPGTLAALAVLALAVSYAAAAVRGQRDRSAGLATGCLVGLAGYGVTLLVGLTSPGPTSLAAFFTGVLVAQPATQRSATTAPANRGRTSTRARQVPTPAGIRAGEVAVAVGAAACGVLFLLAAIAEIPLRSAILDVAAGRAAAANHDFGVVRALRPWDLDVPDVAGHALITEAATSEDPAMLNDAATWLARVPAELDTDEQVRLDRELLDELTGHLTAARALLDEALADDHDNPVIVLRLGVVDGESHDYPAAIREFRLAASIDPSSPTPWEDLALAYQREHQPAAAAAATRHARQLGG